MVNQHDNLSSSRLYLKRFSHVMENASRCINGPQSVMLPGDPKGIESWFEPVVRLKRITLPSKNTRSLSVLCVPNCVEHDSNNTVLVRSAVWNARLDKTRCMREQILEPSVNIVYKSISRQEVMLLDNLLRNLDESFHDFKYGIEGLDLQGNSGFHILPNNAVVEAESFSLEYFRVMRFQQIDIRWIFDKSNMSTFDRCWHLLFDAILEIFNCSTGSSVVNVVEKYTQVWASREN